MFHDRFDRRPIGTSLRARPARTLLYGSAVIVIAVALAACSGSANFASGTESEGGRNAAVQPGQPVPAATAGPIQELTPDKGDVSAGGFVGTGEEPATIGQQDDALVIKTGAVSLEVKDLDEALDAARAAIRALGGYVSGSERTTDGDQPRATVSYRIPADRWDDALVALRKLASKVLAEQTQAVEVTGTVLDLDARIDNLRVTERALQAIMDRATKISDVLEVQAQLTQVRGEIEQLSTEKAHLEEQAALSTLMVSYSLPAAPVVVATKDWNPGGEFDQALASLVRMGQAVVAGLIWFGVVWVPLLIVAALLLAIALFVLRRLARRLPKPPSGPIGGWPVAMAPSATPPAPEA